MLLPFGMGSIARGPLPAWLLAGACALACESKVGRSTPKPPAVEVPPPPSTLPAAEVPPRPSESPTVGVPESIAGPLESAPPPQEPPEPGPDAAGAAAPPPECDRTELASKVTDGCADLASETGGGPCMEAMPVPVRRPRAKMCPSVMSGGHEGSVVMQVTVGCDGTVERVSLQRSLARDCDTLAIDAVKDATFTPAKTVDGTPARVTLRYVIQYRVAD